MTDDTASRNASSAGVPAPFDNAPWPAPLRIVDRSGVLGPAPQAGMRVSGCPVGLFNFGAVGL